MRGGRQAVKPPSGESCSLGGAAASYGGIAYCALEKRAVHRFQGRQKSGNLGQEWIGKDGCDFLIPKAARIPHQLADIHFEGGGQTGQRTERGNRLAVLDFGDVGAGHLHAAGELALREVARLADIAHLSSDLQPGFRRGHDRGVGYQLQNGMWGLLHIKRLAALSAKGVGCSVLHEAAEIAAHNLTCLHVHWGGCHRPCAECQSGLSGVPFCTSTCATFGDVNHNCQVET